MEMSLSLFEFKNSLHALNKIKGQELNFELSYKIAKAIKKITPSVQTYEETVAEFLKEHATYNKDSNQYQITEESLGKFDEFKVTEQKLLNEVTNIEIDLIPIELFKDTKIAPETLSKIMWLIEE